VNAAKKVIDRFGGQSALAALLGKGQSTISYWAKTGTIPAKWNGPLLELAASKEIDLVPGDFMAPAQQKSELEGTAVTTKAPDAKYFGTLQIGDGEISCYVLDDGRRVISRTGATDVLTEKKGGGNLESYIHIEALKSYLPKSLSGQMIAFTISGVVNKTVRGVEAETFLDILRAYCKARDEGALKTESQISIAKRAGAFLAACSKVGLIALIDEATGFQYDRAQDALRFKLKAILEDEMRKWEKTFPDELWREFGRLTNWKGSVTQRPKYWGKLVMELVYGYLDPDVARWLKENAPKPMHGQNYHQWLSNQYGLKKLMEHIWMLVGMASACQTMPKLRQKMAEKYGRQYVQLGLYLPMPRA